MRVNPLDEKSVQVSVRASQALLDTRMRSITPG
jgi:hypothetical protein